MPRETSTDKKLLAWLERNGPWLMKLDSTKIMWRIGLELDHGRLTGRTIEESLLVAGSILRQEYEDGNYATISAASEEGSGGTEEEHEDGGTGTTTNPSTSTSTSTKRRDAARK